METPVLSKTQKKLSLTGKKAKKETIKNVVVDPHKSYWPLVETELDTLTVVLKQSLPRVKAGKINVPWRLLKDIPKDKRKNIRDIYIRKHHPVENIIKNDHLIFGVNEVTKLLESDCCSAVLVADMNPRIVVKHIIEMAVLRKVPVLVVSTLKQILKECCGLESMAVGIKKNLPDSSILRSIVEIVGKINEKYPPSINHINSKRSNIFLDIEENGSLNNVQTSENKNKQEKSVNYHLKRPSDGQRAFVPESNEDDPHKVIGIEACSISELDNVASLKMKDPTYEMVNQAMKKKNLKKSYKALVVKRLKGNKNRQKDKTKKSKKK
ncbi:uncharacterized protein LOC123316978 [Coccinella septempunctata]|uniref:uncharacterized protein LOC123316978 n=1 Tax=Coccinella septempunctata TaxID=41139 RepID=UPI001D073D09|nr:uncharacterized protein LOC123316978 [Coccinella septempunctata]